MESLTLDEERLCFAEKVTTCSLSSDIDPRLPWIEYWVETVQGIEQHRLLKVSSFHNREEVKKGRRKLCVLVLKRLSPPWFTNHRTHMSREKKDFRGNKNDQLVNKPHDVTLCNICMLPLRSLGNCCACLSGQDDGERSLYNNPRRSFLTSSPAAVPVSATTYNTSERYYI